MKGGINLSSLVLNKCSPRDNRIKKESIDRAYPIWLVVNPKYPAVRHDIWAHILDEIQDKVYRKLHIRINTEKIFIKNAVSDIGLVPNTLNWWAADVVQEIVMFRESVLKHQPKILITIGAFPYEFVRRAFEVKPKKGPKYWSNANLEDEFERSIANFDINRTNRIPLLRKVVMSGKLNEYRNYSSLKENENYFRDVGIKIAKKIIENEHSLKIWIE